MSDQLEISDLALAILKRHAWESGEKRDTIDIDEVMDTITKHSPLEIESAKTELLEAGFIGRDPAAITH